MDNLPTELILNILSNIKDPDTLTNICKTNKGIKNICKAYKTEIIQENFHLISRPSLSGGDPRGTIRVKYDDLIKTFGPPTLTNVDNKTTCIWKLLFYSGGKNVFVQIFDFQKRGKGVTPIRCYDWNVSGSNGAMAFARLSLI